VIGSRTCDARPGETLPRRAHDSTRADRAVACAQALILVCAAVACGPGAPGDVAEKAEPPQRIVALTVGSVDTLALLGELERVVAVEEDCFIPGTERLVKIRNDDHAGPSRALNVEAVLALQPDLVIAKEDLKPALAGRGVEVLWIPSASGLDTIVPLVQELGSRLHLTEQARAVVAAMNARRAAIERRVAGLARVRVYFEAGKPGRTAGRGTVVDDMIRLAGGENIAGDLPLANPVLSSEAIVAANPELILLSPWSDAPEEVARRPGWEHIRAVQSGRVHRIPEQDRKLMYPSPSCLDGCEAMLVPWLHPELARGPSEPK